MSEWKKTPVSIKVENPHLCPREDLEAPATLWQIHNKEKWRDGGKSAQTGLCLSELWAAMVFIYKISRADGGASNRSATQTHQNRSSHRARGRSAVPLESIISINTHLFCSSAASHSSLKFSGMNLQQLHQGLAQNRKGMCVFLK